MILRVRPGPVLALVADQCAGRAQTSGGLLISVAAENAEELVSALKQRSAAAGVVIGEVRPRGEKTLVVKG
jgi:hypothetical protein